MGPALLGMSIFANGLFRSQPGRERERERERERTFALCIISMEKINFAGSTVNVVFSQFGKQASTWQACVNTREHLHGLAVKTVTL